MKIKKLVALFLSGMILVACTACGEKVVNLDEKVTLKYVLPGPGMQKDSAMVWEEFNNKLHEKLPNVTVEFEVFPTSDYKQSFMLMQASGEKVDIANTYLLDYASEVRNGSFAPMDELLDKYGKDVKEALPEFFFDYGRVDGVLYQIPSYQMITLPWSLVMQEEFADKYLDKEALESVLDGMTTFPKEAYPILEDYLRKVKESGNIQYGFDTATAPLIRGYEVIGSHYAIRVDDPECKVLYVYEAPEYQEGIKYANEWYKKGYIREDALTAVNAASIRGQMDGYVLWSAQTSPYFIEDMKESGKDLYEVWLAGNEDIYLPSTHSAAGTAIMASSKHKEQAMQLLNLLQTDKELYNLLVFGIEGVHYTKVDENTIETVAGHQPQSGDAYGLNGWIIGNTQLQYFWQLYPEYYHDWSFNVINKSKNHSKLMGFVPDFSKIQAKASQVAALRLEYKDSLASGSVADWKKTYAEWMEKIKIAGNEEIKAELQRQVDEFLAKKK